MKRLILSICLGSLFLSVFSQEKNPIVAAQKIEESKLIILDYPTSFLNLIKQFEGKVIYIDVIASWCKPCISEFKESKKMELYFEQNNIVRLYITLDNKEEIVTCINILRNNAMEGYFTSLHSTEGQVENLFSKDLKSIFFTDENGNVGISIPRYAIVNKKGEIVVKKAERPSNAINLKNQLDKYID